VPEDGEGGVIPHGDDLLLCILTESVVQKPEAYADDVEHRETYERTVLHYQMQPRPIHYVCEVFRRELFSPLFCSSLPLMR